MPFRGCGQEPTAGWLARYLGGTGLALRRGHVS